MLKIGHRGASAYAPENTLSSFRKALELNADGVELDIHCCKSGELVVFHDATVDRITDGSGRVADMTLAQLRMLKVMGHESIITLEEAIDTLGGAYCFVEIKETNTALAAAEIITRYSRDRPPGKLWLISFLHDALKSILMRYPTLYIGASFEHLTPTSIQDAHAWGAKAILPHHQSFGAWQVAQAHALGLNVFSWTVNEPSDITRLRSFDVDGIISDCPERLIEPYA